MKQRLLTLCILILAVALASWQPQPSTTNQHRQFLGDTTIVRNAPVPLPKGDTASKYIKLLPGFQANPANGQFYVATIDTIKRNSNVANACEISIKATDSGGGLREKFARISNGTLQPLQLTLTGERATNFANAQYRWSGPNGLFSTLNTITAAQVGLYELTVINASDTCAAQLILTAPPCRVIDTTTSFCATGQATNPTNDNSPRLGFLTVGDTILANDFYVLVKEVTQGSANGGWTGQGAVLTPYFNTQIEVFFENAIINQCYEYELVSGSRIETTYDPNSGGIIDIDGAVEDIKSVILNLTDALNNYSGTTQEIAKLKNYHAELIAERNRISTDTKLDPLEKALFNTELDDLLNAAPACMRSGAGGGRLAAPNEDGNCPPGQYKTKANAYYQALNPQSPPPSPPGSWAAKGYQIHPNPPNGFSPQTYWLTGNNKKWAVAQRLREDNIHWQYYYYKNGVWHLFYDEAIIEQATREALYAFSDYTAIGFSALIELGIGGPEVFITPFVKYIQVYRAARAAGLIMKGSALTLRQYQVLVRTSRALSRLSATAVRSSYRWSLKPGLSQFSSNSFKTVGDYIDIALDPADVSLIQSSALAGKIDDLVAENAVAKYFTNNFFTRLPSQFPNRNGIDVVLVDNVTKLTKIINLEVKSTVKKATDDLIEVKFGKGYGGHLEMSGDWFKGVIPRLKTTPSSKILNETGELLTAHFEVPGGPVSFEKYLAIVDGNGMCRMVKLQ